MKEYSPDEIMELIEMDVAMTDDQPKCSVVYWFQEPKDLFIVRLIKRLFNK